MTIVFLLIIGEQKCGKLKTDKMLRRKQLKNILVLGATGMLGSMVFSYLGKNKALNVAGTCRNNEDLSFFNQKSNLYLFNANRDLPSQLDNIIKEFPVDYIINCIGVIKPHCRDTDPEGVFNAIKVNSLFPHILNKSIKQLGDNIKIIQIATDCVFSGKKGEYNEDDKHDALDVYGKTKSLGEVQSKNFMNIRCSIIGPEISSKTSLLEWFLSNSKNSEINGFTHHQWNGITTLQFGQFCEEIITQNQFYELRKINHVIHYVPNNSVSKYELLCLIQDVYDTKYIIKEVDNLGSPTDRTLKSKYLNFSVKKNIKDELLKLRLFNN